MNERRIETLVPAMATSDGAGVSMFRAIGTSSLQNVDPFLMLDYFGSDDPDQYIAGFPDHPHRGFVTLTYMLDGNMQHRDSMGNEGNLEAGGVQWMKAASGVIHSEMPQQHEGLMRGFQLWINLPAAEKMSDPAYQEFTAAAVPVVTVNDARVRVISGECAGVRGPIEDPVTTLTYLDVTLAPGATFTNPTTPDDAAFVFVFEGSCAVADRLISEKQTAQLSAGDTVTVVAGNDGARFVLIMGQPINEPVMQHGPFVMNTRAELMQAFEDYQRGELVRTRASVTAR